MPGGVRGALQRDERRVQLLHAVHLVLPVDVANLRGPRGDPGGPRRPQDLHHVPVRRLLDGELVPPAVEEGGGQLPCAASDVRQDLGRLQGVDRAVPLGERHDHPQQRVLLGELHGVRLEEAQLQFRGELGHQLDVSLGAKGQMSEDRVQLVRLAVHLRCDVALLESDQGSAPAVGHRPVCADVGVRLCFPRAAHLVSLLRPLVVCAEYHVHDLLHGASLVAGALPAALHPAHRLVVLWRHQRHALSWRAVPGAAAGFLDVVLDALGQPCVDDHADVWLVQAHSEGHRRDHHAGNAGHEGVLRLPPVLGQHAAVVGPDPAAHELTKAFGPLVCGEALPHVNHRGEPRVLLVAQELEELAELHVLVRHAPHVHRQVGPLHARLRRLLQQLRQREGAVHPHDRVDPQNVADGLYRRSGGRRSQREEPPGVQGAGQEFAEAQVVGAEVMGPLRDAVGLVDARKGDGGQAAAVQRPHG
mmetsp:Transcript_35326/g.92326  ORF Transcript_35326/g.92326 Transcript_35326/m.92326 type:complete len:474 (-) Transcript_35326:485-1906(-)